MAPELVLDTCPFPLVPATAATAASPRTIPGFITRIVCMRFLGFRCLSKSPDGPAGRTGYVYHDPWLSHACFILLRLPLSPCPPSTICLSACPSPGSPVRTREQTDQRLDQNRFPKSDISRNIIIVHEQNQLKSDSLVVHELHSPRPTTRVVAMSSPRG